MTQMQSEKSYKIDEKSLLEEIVITIGEFPTAESSVAGEKLSCTSTTGKSLNFQLRNNKKNAACKILQAALFYFLIFIIYTPEFYIGIVQYAYKILIFRRE